MIIGIDASSIPYHTGVSNYTLNLIKNLIAFHSTDTYKIFYSSRGHSFPSELEKYRFYPNVKIYHYRLPLAVLEFLWNRLHLFPIELFIGRCDIFHTSDWTQPPSIAARLVTTVHDLAPFVNPKWHHQQVVDVHRRKMSLAQKHCAAFICVSNNTKDDIVRFFPKINQQKIHVVYEAAETKYAKFKKLPKSSQNKKIKIFKSHYELDNFFLAQATREPRKNLDRLIAAFNIFIDRHPDSTAKLAIAGKYGWGKDVIPSRDHIKILGFVAEKDMVVLHASALCLVYPSLYEGFGLPVVKSLTVGTPVITSNLSSLPEVADHAAILVDPYSVDEITRAMEAIYLSTDLRRQLAQAGLRHSKQFSWRKTAALTHLIYQQLAVK